MVAKFERTAIISYAHPVCKGRPFFFALQDSAGLANFGAAEAVSGPSLGACAARGPRLEVVCGRMRWLHSLANQAGPVGTGHRQLVSSSDTAWVEPFPALASTLPKFER